MTIQLSEKEFMDLVEDTIEDAFNVPSGHSIKMSHSYSGVTITIAKKERKTEEPEGATPANPTDF